MVTIATIIVCMLIWDIVVAIGGSSECDDLAWWYQSRAELNSSGYVMMRVMMQARGPTGDTMM